MMKVLIYNWCPLWSTEGGGVALYIRNILSELKDRCEVFFLNSGYYYDEDSAPYIRDSVVNTCPGIRSFDLVNSPMMAPMKSPADNIRRFLEDESLLPLLRDFLAEKGIDVIHFNNLEGLTIPCLRVKDELDGIRFIYSIHNYAPFCPAVNYWTSDGSNCFVLENRDCSKCMVRYRLPSSAVRRRFRMRKNDKAYLLGRLETHLLNALAFNANRDAYSSREYEELFAAYREEQVRVLNDCFDSVHAVSKRVADIAVANGVDKAKLHVAYIGTRFAGRPMSPRIKEKDGLFGLVFMGYMKKEKGLPFLVDALMALDDATLGEITLTVAAKLSDPGTYLKLKKLCKRLGGFRYYNGYTHDQIPEILDEADLGIVPVLWEDNMAQVAMEYASSGVPVLASAFGGASEITNNSLFTFAGGDVVDLLARITYFMENRSELGKYWDNVMELPSVESHVDEMMRLYGGDVR